MRRELEFYHARPRQILAQATVFPRKNALYASLRLCLNGARSRCKKEGGAMNSRTLILTASLALALGACATQETPKPAPAPEAKPAPAPAPAPAATQEIKPAHVAKPMPQKSGETNLPWTELATVN